MPVDMNVDDMIQQLEKHFVLNLSLEHISSCNGPVVFVIECALLSPFLWHKVAQEFTAFVFVTAHFTPFISSKTLIMPPRLRLSPLEWVVRLRHWTF